MIRRERGVAEWPWPPSLTHRRRRAEWMDDPDLDPALHAEALLGLARFHTLGLMGSMMRRVLAPYRRAVGARPLRLLELGCGRGDVLTEIVSEARGGIVALGLDISAEAIGQARGRLPRRLARRVDFRVADVLDESTPLPRSDVAFCNMFLHHFDEAPATTLLRRMAAAARHGVIVCDLSRDVPSWMQMWIGSRIISRSPVVHFDGLRSVEGAWTLDELAAMARAAGLRGVKCRRVFPVRLLLTTQP